MKTINKLPFNINIIRILLIAFLFLITMASKGQVPKDTITIKHKFYKTTFNKKLLYPVKVEFWITKKSSSCTNKFSRTDNFTPDPTIPQYTNLDKNYNNSGYDRGHNCDAEDNICDFQGMNESFYYSNMTPQSPLLNRGVWKTLEIYCRSLAASQDSIKVVCGSIGMLKIVNGLTIPKFCWKVIYIKKTKVKEFYLFLNNGIYISKDIKAYKVTQDYLQKLTGLKF